MTVSAMLFLGAVLLTLVLTVIAAQYLKLQLSRSRYPPGPTPLPIIGSLWTLKFELRHETLMQLAKTYGNTFTLWLGQTPAIVLNGCQAIRYTLVTHSEEMAGRPATPTFERLSRGKGVVFSSGQTWKQQRRFCLMTLRNLGLGKTPIERRIQEEVQNLVESLASNKGKAMDPAPILTHSVASVISAVVFGHRFSSGDKGFHQFIKGTNSAARLLGSMWARLFDAFPWLMQHLPGPHQTVFKLIDFQSRFVKEEIEKHRENGIPEEPQDFIDFYLTQLAKGSDDATSTFDQDNLMYLVIELFGAGMETTTSTLLWALLYMMTQPDIQEKVQKELDAVLDESQAIQYEDRKRLPYTNAVIHEIHRYCNIQGIGIFRQVLKEVSLLGYTIEKGTIVIPNLPSAMNDPEYWKTPDQFNPANFLDKEGQFVTTEAFLPFSAGHRMCLGEQLARPEIFIFFTSLLRGFTFRIPERVVDINMDYMPGSILKPYPYKICAIPR
ncbi:cytochrome P450 2J4-like [Pleurodeles waltl]|uniref:cytochrome P450 2J4-like n=1 Tax=Pleurodeles waltl TaxID=8319 RepID=UPI0037095CF6